MRAGRFETLDGMRGICALIIVIFHCDIFLLNNGHLLNHGWLCVDVFFVLSGFVIALVYQDRLSARNGFAAFLKARAARLLPVQFIGTAAVALTALGLFFSHQLHIPGLTLGALLITAALELVLIPNQFSPVGALFAFTDAPYPLNPPLWSLFDEWLVNIIYGRVLHATRTGALLGIVLCLAAGLVFVVLNTSIQWKSTDDLFRAARAAAEFLSGVLLFRLQAGGRLSRLPSLRPEIVYSLWFLVCAVPMAQPHPLFEAAAALVVAPLAIALLIRSERPLPAFYSRLGEISYPLYASHFAVITLFLAWIHPSTERHSAAWLLVLLPAAILLAFGINFLAAAGWRAYWPPARLTGRALPPRAGT